MEISCYALGLLLVGAYAAAQVQATAGQQHAVEAFRVAQAQIDTQDSGGSAALGDTVDTSLWAAGRVAAYEKSLAVSMRAPAALLHIPAIDLSVPVFEGTAELNMTRGVGRIEGTADIGGDGNLGIAGHRDGFFRGLKDIKVGDVIEVEMLDERLSYRVVDLTIVEPSDIEVLDDTPEPALTLVTCYPFYFIGHAPQRFIVRAVRLDSDPGLST